MLIVRAGKVKIIENSVQNWPTEGFALKLKTKLKGRKN